MQFKVIDFDELNWFLLIYLWAIYLYIQLKIIKIAFEILLILKFRRQWIKHVHEFVFIKKASKVWLFYKKYNYIKYFNILIMLIF